MHDRSKIIAQVTALRTFYPADNRVGLALDELIADLTKGKLRKAVLKEASAIQQMVGPTATVHKVIDRIVRELSLSASPRSTPARPNMARGSRKPRSGAQS